MQKYLFVLLALIGVGFGACAVTEVSEPVPQQEATPIIVTRTLLLPTVLPTPSLVPMELATATSTPSPTISTSLDSVPILVATMESDPYLFSVPENVWWSEDSQTLYYQDIETHKAWAYNLSTGISTSIAYEPRSLHELAPPIQETLPENASIVSLSPYNHFILYRTPLPEPIPIPENPSVNSTPEFKVSNSYTAELWLRKDGQDFNLGLVDDCFGLMFAPLWSTDEDVVIVNGQGIDGVACLHSVWLIDLETLSMGALDSPWTENYKVLDLSANGKKFLIRSYTDRLNYLYDSTTNEQWIISVDDTDRMMLLETGQSLHCLVFDLEFSRTILRDHVWYCEPKSGEINLLTTIEGQISQHIVSPDKKFIALMVDNDFPQGNFYEDITPGIWILALP